MMVDRIKQIMEYAQMSATAFADRIGIGRSSMTHIFSGRNQPSLDVAKKILLAFPEINTEWLIMGMGVMLREERPLPEAIPAAERTMPQERAMPPAAAASDGREDAGRPERPERHENPIPRPVTQSMPVTGPEPRPSAGSTADGRQADLKPKETAAPKEIQSDLFGGIWVPAHETMPAAAGIPESETAQRRETDTETETAAAVAARAAEAQTAQRPETAAAAVVARAAEAYSVQRPETAEGNGLPGGGKYPGEASSKRRQEAHIQAAGPRRGRISDSRGDRKISKIVFFYDDRTFDIYLPS